MIGFANNMYAKVWEIKLSKSGKSYSVQLSTSEKKDDGTYEPTFSAWTIFSGHAANKIKQEDLKSGDSIQIKKCCVLNKYDKEKKLTNWSCFVSDYECKNKSSSVGQTSTSSPEENTIDGDEPF